MRPSNLISVSMPQDPDGLAADVEELALNPRAPEYVPPVQYSMAITPAHASISNAPALPHSQLFSMPHGPPQACWPYLGCVPMSPGHAHFAWPSSGVSLGFASPFDVISQGCNYGYSGAQHRAAGYQGVPGSVSSSHPRDRPSGWRRSQFGASSSASNSTPIASNDARAADETRGLSSRGGQLPSAPGGLQADRPHQAPSQGHIRQPGEHGNPCSSAELHGHPVQSNGRPKLCSGDKGFVQPSQVGSAGNSFATGGGGAGAGGSTTTGSSAGKRGRRGGDCRMRPMDQGDLQSHIARTVYICDVEKNVTEEMLARFFDDCGAVMDVRVCGDANQDLRFAFLEFTEEHSVELALRMTGREVAGVPLRVTRSKTAIAPVNSSFLPRTLEEREQCSRTIYCSNLDRAVERRQLIVWFEKFAGPVSNIRMKSDVQHSTRIAFIEFEEAADAQKALRECSGALLGTFNIRISPSKTPVRNVLSKGL